MTKESAIRLFQDQKVRVQWDDLEASQKELSYKENEDGTVTITLKSDIGALEAKIGFNGVRYYNKFTFTADATQGGFGQAQEKRVYWDTVLAEKDAIDKDASSVKTIVKQTDKILFWQREKLVKVDVSSEKFDDVIVDWKDFKQTSEDEKQTKTRAERKTAGAQDNKYKKSLSRVWFYENGKKDDIEVDPILSTENNSTVITIQTSGVSTADFKLVFKEEDAGISEYYKGTGSDWSANYGSATELLTELDQDTETQVSETSTLKLLEASSQRVKILNTFDLTDEVCNVSEEWTIYPDGTIIKKIIYVKGDAGTEVRRIDEGNTDFVGYDTGQAKVVSGYYSGSEPSATRALGTTYTDYQLIELLGNDFDEVTDYQNPLSLSLSPGSLEQNAYGDANHDGFNETENSYELISSTSNLLSFNFDGLTVNRFSPFFKIYSFYPDYEESLTPVAHYKMNDSGDTFTVDDSFGSNNGSFYGDVPVPSGLLGHWKLNNDLLDSSGNGNNANSLDLGLKGVWSFEQNWLDATGNNNNGTNSGATFSTDRKLGSYSAYFNKASYVNLGSSSTLCPTTAITIALWAKNLGGRDITPNEYLVCRGNAAYTSAANNAYQIVLGNSSPDYLAFHVSNGTVITGTENVTAVQCATLGTGWHFIVGTWDGATIRLYVDGVLRSSVAHSGSIMSVPVNTYLGQCGDGSRKFIGYLDEMGIYNRAISQTEITALYNAGVGRIYTEAGGAFVTAKTGSHALDFNGTTNFADVGTSSAFNFTSEDFSVGMWIKPNTTWTGSGDIVLSRGSYQLDGYYIQLLSANPFRATMIFNQAGTAQSINSNTVMNRGEWNHILFVRSGSNVHWYINGEEQTSGTPSFTNPLTSARHLYLGKEKHN